MATRIVVAAVSVAAFTTLLGTVSASAYKVEAGDTRQYVDGVWALRNLLQANT